MIWDRKLIIKKKKVEDFGCFFPHKERQAKEWTSLTLCKIVGTQRSKADSQVIT